jgi:hypothetical protein
MPRDKQIGLKFDSEDVDRWDAWAAEHGFSRTTMIEAAMERLMESPVAVAPPPKAAPTHGSRRRRAYVCANEKCVPPRRIFLAQDQPERVPDCPEGHGPMVRQGNRDYLGQPV